MKSSQNAPRALAAANSWCRTAVAAKPFPFQAPFLAHDKTPAVVSIPGRPHPGLGTLSGTWLASGNLATIQFHEPLLLLLPLEPLTVMPVPANSSIGPVGYAHCLLVRGPCPAADALTEATCLAPASAPAISTSCCPICFICSSSLSALLCSLRHHPIQASSTARYSWQLLKLRSHL